MLSVTSDYIDAIRSINRSFTFSVSVNGVTLDGSVIKSIKIVETGVSSKKLTPGDYSKNSCELVVTSGNGQQWADRIFTVQMTVGDYSDPIPLGKFWVNTIKDQDSGYAYKITAYSRDPWWDEPYDSTNGYTAVSDILSYMETESGSTILNKNLITLAEVEAIPSDVTNAQLLGYFAGHAGYCVRTSRTGHPELFRYAQAEYSMLVPSNTLYPSATLYPGSTGDESTAIAYTVGIDQIFEGGLTVEKSTTINSYAVTNDQETITVGSGYGIEYVNPFVKDISEVEAMALYLDETYTPLNARWRGDPALEIGDVIQVDGSTCYIMEQTFEIDGGFRCTVKSYSNESSKMVLGKTTLDRKIKEIYSGMLEEIQKIYMGIFDAGNGYFSFIDENHDPISFEDIINGAVPAGFRISDEPEITATTKGWEFVLGGLYSTDDGFRTPGQLALTQDGYIVGSRILADSISTQALDVSLKETVNGVNTNFKFLTEGLRIARLASDGTIASTYHTFFSDKGMRVIETATEKAVLVAEEDTVVAANLTADQYLRVRSDNVAARFQQFYSTAHQEFEYGVFKEIV